MPPALLAALAGAVVQAATGFGFALVLAALPGLALGVLWLEGEGVRPAESRATLAAAFLGLDVVGAVLLVSTDGGATVDVGVVGPLLACVLGGYGLGALAFRRLGPGRFFPIVLGLVVCAGIASALAGVLYASRGACAT